MKFFSSSPAAASHVPHLVLRGRCPQDFREGISWLGLDQIHQHLLGARDQREVSGTCSRPSLAPPHNIQLLPKGFLPTLSIPAPQYPPDACRSHPHLSSRLRVSLSSLLATGTSLLVRVREISVLLSWESTCSALLSPRLPTLSPARAERALLAVLGSREPPSRAPSNPARKMCPWPPSSHQGGWWVPEFHVPTRDWTVGSSPRSSRSSCRGSLW